MGYEVAIAPEPNREEERRIIERVKNSFRNQRYTQNFMSESARINKIEYARISNWRKGTLVLNTLIGSTIGWGIAWLFIRWTRVGRGGLPKMRQNKLIVVNEKIVHQSNLMKITMLKKGMPFAILFGLTYGMVMTSTEFENRIGIDTWSVTLPE